MWTHSLLILFYSFFLFSLFQANGNDSTQKARAWDPWTVGPNWSPRKTDVRLFLAFSNGALPAKGEPNLQFLHWELWSVCGEGGTCTGQCQGTQFFYYPWLAKSYSRSPESRWTYWTVKIRPILLLDLEVWCYKEPPAARDQH